jgi:arylsulfatase A-like enzyme
MAKATPNINKLAQESVVFDSAYATAGSTPSRASFLTARHALRSGMVSGSRFGLSYFSPAQSGSLDPQELTLPEMLKTDIAYGPMGHFGTWHLGYGNGDGTGLPLHHGYDHFFGTLAQPSLKSCDNNVGTQSTVAQDKYGNPLDAETPEAQAAAAEAAAGEASARASLGTTTTQHEYGLTWWAMWSLTSIVWQSLVVLTIVSWFADMMSNKTCVRVLFVVVAVLMLPCFLVLDTLTLSNPSSCILLRNDRIVEQPVRMGTYLRRVTDEALHFVESTMTCSRHRCQERKSFAMTVSYPMPPPNSLNALFGDDYTGLGKEADALAEVDHNIGVLLRKINHLGLRSRTLVVLTGFAPDYFSAQTGRNGPMRVPLVVSFEGHTSEGMRDHHPVDIMDIMPTFLQLADVPSPVHLDGQSFWPLIHKHATKDMRAQAQRQAQNRPLLHYCRDTAVGMSKGDYTLLLEEGDGTHSCGGRQLVPPRLCNRATDPHCKDWIALGPSMDQDMGLIASAMLDAWQPQHEHVMQDDTGARKTTAWPVWSNYPCCGDTCTCARDVPPQKGQAPRAKPKSGGRAYAGEIV